ncbi:MAG: hypothetical protein CSA74_09680 [Rhodobacterales bacterium]|nr:MAG: hypothetical protein CSA74_09680 [Rhodobacterales bacterium]
MKPRNLTFLAAGLALAIPAMASADTFPEHFLSNYDFDKDGFISLDELKKKRNGGFKKFDANGNGMLEPEEYGALKAHQATQEAIHRGKGMSDAPRKVHDAVSIFVMDTDRDGLTTNEEFIAASVAWFNSVDADGDGKLSADELGAL